MWAEIQKEVSENLDRLNAKTKELGVKLVSFVICCWLISGSVALGLIAPVYLLRSVTRMEWVKEANAANVSFGNSSRAQAVQRETVIDTPWRTSRSDSSRALRRPQTQPSIKSGLEETKDVVSQVRSLASGLRALVRR